jgi:hypothetical protein
MLDVNWLAILACGVVSMVLGFLWYGPLFGKLWITLSGHNPSPDDKAKANKGYAISFIGALVLAYVFYHFLVYSMDYTDTTGAGGGLSVGFWAWLGFIAPVTLGTVLWEGKSWKLWFLNNGYNLVQLLLFGLILALWM